MASGHRRSASGDPLQTIGDRRLCCVTLPLHVCSHRSSLIACCLFLMAFFRSLDTWARSADSRWTSPMAAVPFRKAVSEDRIGRPFQSENTKFRGTLLGFFDATLNSVRHVGGIQPGIHSRLRWHTEFSARWRSPILEVLKTKENLAFFVRNIKFRISCLKFRTSCLKFS